MNVYYFNLLSVTPIRRLSPDVSIILSLSRKLGFHRLTSRVQEFVVRCYGGTSRPLSQLTLSICRDHVLNSPTVFYSFHYETRFFTYSIHYETR